jgi:TonB family protein
MARLLALILFLLAARIPDPLGLPVHARTGESNQQEWTRFRVTKEGFSILLPERPAVVFRGRRIRGLLQRNTDVRKYAAYADGVVYQVVSFGNPKHTESLDYFEAEIRVDELRGATITTRTEMSNGEFGGLEFSFKRYDYNKSYGYPGVARIYQTKERSFALVAIGKDESDRSVQRFMQSLELKDRPAGEDVGTGARSNPDEPQESAGTPVLETREVSVKPMILIKAEPLYTQEARRHLTRGRISLSAVFAASGRVTNIEVLAGLPYGLTERALETARKTYFIPAMKDGRFVSTRMLLEYGFDIY